MNCSLFEEFRKALIQRDFGDFWIWGAAAKGQMVYDWLMMSGEEDAVRGFIDSDPNKWGKKCRGKTIFNPEILKEDSNGVVVIASNAVAEISHQIYVIEPTIRCIDVCRFAIKSRLKETFSQYKDKKYYIINDEYAHKAELYFNDIKINVSGIVDISNIVRRDSSDIIYIIIGINHSDIERELISLGYDYNRDYVVLTDIFYDGYKYLKPGYKVSGFDNGTLGDKGLEGYFCPMPFTQLYYYDTRSGICSPTWNHEINVGSPTEKTVDELWNSPVAKLVRESVLSGSFYFCNEERCWRILDGKLLKRDEITDKKLRDIIDNNRLEIEGGPEFLNIGYNADCNINCKMCRSEIIPRGTQQNVQLLQDRLKEFEFTNLKRLIIPGNGELFLNPDYMYILEHIDEFKFPNLEAIWIYSNGVLFTEEKFDKYVAPLADKYKIKIFISTDGFYKETYQKVRRGNYEIFTRNLQMLGRKRQEGKFDTLLMPFCCQKENFREMTKFVKYAKEIGADCVHFEKLFYNPIEETVHRPEHIYYEEFVAELRNAVLLGEKIGMDIDCIPFSSLIKESE